MAVEIVGAYYLKASGIIIALYLATMITSLVGMRFYSIRTLRNANYPHQEAWMIKYSAYVKHYDFEPTHPDGCILIGWHHS